MSTRSRTNKEDEIGDNQLRLLTVSTLARVVAFTFEDAP